MGVDRCVCYNVRFADLRRNLQQSGVTEDALRWIVSNYSCGRNCGMCLAYLHVMLERGISNVPVLPTMEYQNRRAFAESEVQDLLESRSQNSPGGKQAAS